MDYEVLRVVWWLLLGVLLAGFAVFDGFDMGAAILLPFLAKTDVDKRIIINTVGPVWEGNQVWFILGGGAIFAAWPILYAVSFSSFYLAMLLVLFGFILRPVGFRYRSKLESSRWRSSFDALIFLGGAIPALLFGVALGNVLLGIPFYFDLDLRAFYTGEFIALLNPFAILCGVVSFTMLAQHGAYYLITKTVGDIPKRASRMARILGLVWLVSFLGAGLWVAFGVEGYSITSAVLPEGPSNPLLKTVEKSIGTWFANYQQYPLTRLVPIIAVLSCLAAMFFSYRRADKTAFVMSACMQIATVATVGVSMFPFLLPSSSFPNQSLTVWDASSSASTLQLMFIMALIFMPITLLYTAWVYRVLRGKITTRFIEDNDDAAY